MIESLIANIRMEFAQEYESKERKCLENTYVTNMYAFGMAKIRLRTGKRRPSTHCSPLSSSTVRSSHSRFQEVELQKCNNWNLNEWINVCEALTKCNCQLWLAATRELRRNGCARALGAINLSTEMDGHSAGRTLQSIHQSINFNGIVEKKQSRCNRDATMAKSNDYGINTF